MNLVRRNLHNVVFVLDLSQPSALAVISDSVRGFIARAIPIRFGLVPVVSMEHESNDVSALVAKVLWHLVERYGRASAMQFCSSVRLIPVLTMTLSTADHKCLSAGAATAPSNRRTPARIVYSSHGAAPRFYAGCGSADI